MQFNINFVIVSGVPKCLFCVLYWKVPCFCGIFNLLFHPSISSSQHLLDHHTITHCFQIKSCCLVVCRCYSSRTKLGFAGVSSLDYKETQRHVKGTWFHSCYFLWIITSWSCLVEIAQHLQWTVFTHMQKLTCTPISTSAEHCNFQNRPALCNVQRTQKHAHVCACVCVCICVSVCEAVHYK